MRATVSISGAAAYGKTELVPDIQPSVSLVEVAQRVVHGFPGSVEAVAALIDMSPNTLAHKINPNNSRHNLHPDELIKISRATGNDAILQSFAGQLGRECSNAMPDQSGGSIMEAFWRWQEAVSDLSRAVADPLYARGVPTLHEARRVSACVADVKAAASHLDAVMRALVPAPPTSSGSAP